MSAEFQPKTLVCRDCQQDFIWSSGEQKFFSQKGLTNAPSRCPKCREIFRQKKSQGELRAPIKCSQCGLEDEVPFSPRDRRAVFCQECFEKSILAKEVS